MSVTGSAEGEPTKTGYATADLFCGLYATIAVLAALHRRTRTGRGACIDCALMDSQVAVLANQALNYLVSGEVPGRLGNAHPNLVPYEVFPTADSYAVVAVGNEAQFRRLCAILRREDLGADPAYATNALRVANRATLVPALAAATIAFSRAELIGRLETAGVPCGPINTVDEVFADPQVRHRGLRLDLSAPAARGGRVPGVRTPIVIDGQPAAHPAPSPGKGEHTRSVKSDPAWAIRSR